MATIDLEYLILGACFNSPRVLEKALDMLGASSFQDNATRAIYECFKELHSQKIELDLDKLLIKLDPELKNPFIRIINMSFSSSEADHYLNMLLEKNRDAVVINQICLASTKCQKGVDIKEVIEDLQMCFLQYAEQLEDSETQNLQGILKDYTTSLQERMEAHEKGEIIFDGITTGFKDLDKIIGGYGNGHLVLVGARTGVGKTVFLLNTMYHKIVFSNEPTLFISLEMSAAELANRLVSMKSSVSSDELKRGSLEHTLFQDVVEATSYLGNLECYICDRPGMTFDYLRTYCKSMVRKRKIKAIYIDYLQMLRSIKNYENRQTEMSAISKNLKMLARELQIPIVCLGQLNREVERRESKMPIISDLRESGQLEQDSDVIILLNRPDSYDETHKPGIMEVKVAKNRHGPCGLLSLYFNKETVYLADHIDIEKINEPSDHYFNSTD